MVVGKRARLKNWIAEQAIDSFSENELQASDAETIYDSDDEEHAINVNGSPKTSLRNHEKPLRRLANSADDWDSFEQLAYRSICTSKTSIRTQFLGKTLPKYLRKNSEFPPYHFNLQLKLTPRTFGITISFSSFACPALTDSGHFDGYVS